MFVSLTYANKIMAKARVNKLVNTPCNLKFKNKKMNKQGFQVKNGV